MKKPRLPRPKVHESYLACANSLTIEAIINAFKKDFPDADLSVLTTYGKLEFEVGDGYLDYATLVLTIPPDNTDIALYEAQLKEYEAWRKNNPPTKRKVKSKLEKIKEQAEKELAELEKRRTELINIVRS